MNNENLKTLIWDSLLDSDLNTRYWKYLGREYYLFDLWSRIILAFTSSTTVVSWGFISSFDTVWKGFSIFSAIFALLVLFNDWLKKKESADILKRKWTIIKNDYELLWASIHDTDIEPDTIKNELDKIHKKENETSDLESNLDNNNEKLRNKCYEDVIRSRGLT